MPENPYEPPRDTGKGGGLLELPALREVVVGWEKLRLLYNVILLIPGIGILALMIKRQDLPLGAAVAGAIFMGIGANLAFMLGPIVEIYFRGLFRNGQTIGRGRWLIFGAGLVVSAGVFGLALLGALV
ncbi:MAG: hypothetical protein AAGI48_04920 [Verrucomicrobiota bacterium]